jgi:hypothetical protein
MSTHVMKVEINEMAKAFRVNGVTLAKRHLRRVFPRHDHKPDDKILAQYLAVVPMVKDLEITQGQNEAVRYGIFKARKVYIALGLNEDNTVPFIIMAREMAGGFEEEDFLEGMEESPKAPTLH